MPMREIVEIVARVAEIERRLAGFVRHGTVAEVDTAKHRIRLKLGEGTDGGDFLSPWLPYAQMAGVLKIHTPPSKGQQFSLIAPNGDWSQAVALPLTWSNQDPSPSTAADENVLTYGNVRATLKDDFVEVTVGGLTMTVTSDGVAITGGKVTHDGRNIGSTHIHGGVVPGGGLTDVPAN